MLIENLNAQLAQYRAMWFIRQSRYRSLLLAMPPSLFMYWQKTAPFEFPGIPQNAFFFARASEGLMKFFDCVTCSQQACALPSKAADSVWHAWNKFSSISLDKFCTEHFGRTIPHVEHSDMPGSIENALAVCLVTARRLDGISEVSSEAPSLFTLDLRLKMPHGYAYQHIADRLGFQPMTSNGKASGSMHFPHSFQPAQLLALGLINQYTFEQLLQPSLANNRHRPTSKTNHSYGDGASCGSFSIDSGSNSDCSSGHSGDCGGSGCGSSCGSSCGGGCGSS